MLPVQTTFPDDFLLKRTDQVKLFLVGEAPGEQEEKKGRPFVGYSGDELTFMLRDAGIDRREVALANVFRFRPPGNKIEEFCLPKADLPPDYPKHLSALERGKYVKPELLPELDRLRREIERARPNLIVALGNTPLWALCGRTGISNCRGAIMECRLVPGYKVLPTFHPAYVLRNWSERVTVVADLIKASREQLFPEIKRPAREIWLEPTVEDVQRFIHRFIMAPDGTQLCPYVSVDIETKPSRKLITCIALSPNPALSLVIPFIDERKPSGSYWEHLEEEAEVDWLLDQVLRRVPIIGQNFGYDLKWLWDLGYRPKYVGDTMYRHHALYAELPKTLAFMGSIHTDEVAWKLDRPKGYHTGKREE